MSTNVVVPARIISRHARRVPQRTNSSVTFFASAGKIAFWSQSWSGRSSARPRNKTIAAWVCVLVSPGRTTPPAESMVRRERYRRPESSRGPAAANRDSAVLDHPAAAVHRHDGSAADQEVRGFGSFGGEPSGSEKRGKKEKRDTQPQPQPQPGTNHTAPNFFPTLTNASTARS